MPAISSCPKCQRQVSIPRGVAAAAMVRCPLCDAAYALSEALALAPPELIPIGYATAASRKSARAVASEESVSAFDNADVDDAGNFAEDSPLAADVENEEVEKDEAATVFPPRIVEEDDKEDDEEGADQENEAAAVARGLPASSVSAHLRKRPSRSAWRTALEVVTGGLAGCLVAYYGLAWWFGPDLDEHLPKLPLPGISRLTAPPAVANPPAQQPPLEKPDHS